MMVRWRGDWTKLKGRNVDDKNGVLVYRMLKLVDSFEAGRKRQRMRFEECEVKSEGKESIDDVPGIFGKCRSGYSGGVRSYSLVRLRRMLLKDQGSIIRGYVERCRRQRYVSTVVRMEDGAQEKRMMDEAS